MTTIPAVFAEYVGLPYADKGRTRAGADCWGGVRMVLAEVFGIALPDYANAYRSADDRLGVARAVEAGLAAGWRRVAKPQCGDLVIIRVGSRPWHCALMVTGLHFLHWLPPSGSGKQTLSCIERLDSPRWARRIEGFYRFTMAAPLALEEAA